MKQLRCLTLIKASRKCDIYNVYKMGVYLAIQKNEDMQFDGKLMQLEDIMLSEVSQVQKEKGHMCSLICGR
jgi:hypothetical protein